MNTTVSRRTVVGGMAGAAALTTLPRHPADATTVLSESSASERGARSVSPLRPIRSTTEHLTDPLGIDTTRPRFGWQLEAVADTDRSGENRSQTAYRILVATSKERVLAGDPDAWDSGRVKSGEQTARLYDGEPLRSRTRYYWAVQVWDEHGRPGPLSPIGWFETAMLDPQKEWTAAWIGSGIEVPRSVQTLSPADRGEKTLEPGHTLGQTITSPGPMVAVGILLGGSGAAVMTLRRGGPDGAVLGRTPIESIEGETLGRVDLEETAPAGTYYVELAEPRGEVLWTSVEADVYPGGTAFEDGDPVEGHDRWVCSIPPDPPANPLLRREFDVADEIASARLYVVGLGLGIPWINGHRVGDAVLSPSVTDYDQRILYSTYDVTRLLRRGRNAIGIALGRGFYSTRAPESDGSHLKPWVAEPRARAQLEIRLRSGRTIVVGTGPDWQVTEGPTTYEAILTGESYDARRAVELDGWTKPGFDAKGWRHAEVVDDPGGRMQAFAAEPMRTAAPIRPVRVTTPEPGVRLYDFGMVLAGWCRLRGRFPKGTTIRLLHHEKLGPSGRIEVGAPGGVHNPSIVGRLQLDEFTASGQGEETWESSFNYKGFQYVEVTGTSAPLELVAVPVLSDLADTMDLEIGHPVLQWIADAFRQTLRNGLHGYPDVAPFSKLGWVGQTYLAGKPMLYQFGMAGLLEKWLDDLRLNQTAEGELPITAPMGQTSGWPGPSLTIAYPYLVHQYWLMFGDRTIPERHYDAVRKHIGWLLGKLENGISTDIFADWYPPHLTTSYPQGPEGPRLVGTAFVIRILQEGAALADLLGKQTDARRWRVRADELTRRFDEEFFDAETGTYRTERPVGLRQTSQAVPLQVGLVPKDRVNDLVAELAADVERKGNHLDTGSIGTSALPFALTDHGDPPRPDLALAVLQQRTYPGYGYLRSLGATTFWESWEKDSRGHNDSTLSSPVRWLVERVVGVEPIAPAWARFRVAPRAFGSLPGARAALDTVRGRVEVRWRRSSRRVRLEVVVPVNAIAEVTLPDGRSLELGSGRHLVESTLPARR